MNRVKVKKKRKINRNRVSEREIDTDSQYLKLSKVKKKNKIDQGKYGCDNWLIHKKEIRRRKKWTEERK